jgi:molybdate transport system substrate-binding protein
MPRPLLEPARLHLTLIARCVAAAAALVLALLPAQAMAERISVAVAANFNATFQKIAPTFERETGHQLMTSSASTGKLYAQISHGAPFQVFLSADDETPARLEKEGLTVPGTRFTYAVGRLALWSANSKLIDERPEVLKTGGFKHLALANPKLAPYGVAAVQTLEKLGLSKPLEGRLVLGENIAQTHQFVASGNAELGFVALSQVMVDGQMGAGSFWLVPPSMHDALRQDAVLLNPGKASAGARELLQYLRSTNARAAITGSGYGF